jgi:hypothetical protein
MAALQKQVAALNDKKDKADSELDQIIQGITLDEKL